MGNRYLGRTAAFERLIYDSSIWDYSFGKHDRERGRTGPVKATSASFVNILEFFFFA